MKDSEFDDEIVEIFVNDYRPLCICAEKIVRNQEEAKDIVSDVFLKLCINRNRIQISQNKKGYMYQCVRNSCLNYLEHKKMMKNYAQAQNEKLEACDDNNPLTAMISKEELFKIEQALNSLPPRCKQVFILAKFDRLSYQEIADQLKISINTVNRQITIAKDELGKMLGNT